MGRGLYGFSLAPVDSPCEGLKGKVKQLRSGKVAGFGKRARAMGHSQATQKRPSGHMRPAGSAKASRKAQPEPPALFSYTLRALRKSSLEGIINKIPAAEMQSYTDGSKDDRNSCGSSIFVKALIVLIISKLGIRTFVLFFRSELIAIDEALRIIKTVTSSDEIWIIFDSRVLSTP
ncbi:hypothetical protein TNCV_1392691 [Trichonephila clavipes]|nr:hypothetical protein TNCV_1392691 [Trichonephila clavipes]